MKTSLFGVIAAVVSIGAGVYLLTSESAAENMTVFDILMHGMGAYFVARGAWMLHELGVGARKVVDGTQRRPQGV